MGNRWNLLKARVKSKFLSMFSTIYLHGLIRVAGIGDLMIEGRCGL